jgi:hypothetical protein
MLADYYIMKCPFVVDLCANLYADVSVLRNVNVLILLPVLVS